MYDENEIPSEMLEEEQKREPSLREKISASNQRNAANNANVVRNAADIASKSANPYAKAIGGAVKAADKLSGGRASQALGKQLNLANKLAPGGRLAQAALKKMSESGTADRISNAVNKKNQNMPQNNKMPNNHSNDLGPSQNSDNESDSGGDGILSYKATVKLIITALMVMTPILVIIIFCNLFISASQIFINSIDIGTADSLTGSEPDKKIEESKDKWNNEITDDHENISYIPNSDIYVLNIVDNKKYVQVAKKYNEADLDELNDFYGNSIYESVDTTENIDMNTVYAFYFKLYYIYSYYQTQYGVELDLPLLMATLNVNTKDRAIIFGSNTIGYDDKQIALKEENDRFDYNKVHNYVSTPTKGEKDIEVLAQHMVSYQATESCVDSNGEEVETSIIRDAEIGTQVLACEEGQTYQVTEPKYAIDEEKYREFLPEFLENKYFINNSLEGEESAPEDISTCSLIVKNGTYYKIKVPQTESCYVPKFSNTEKGIEPTFYKNVMALINDAKSQGCDAKIISGYRSYSDQAYFYNCYKTGKCNNGNLAAEPGYSNHEYGIAADLNYIPYTSKCLNYYHNNAHKYGLNFPLLYHATHPENWHIEPINIVKGNPK